MESSIRKRKGNLTKLLRSRILWRRRISYAQNHYFRRLDQRCRALPGFQAHFFGRVRGDNRGDLLFANLQRDLREQAAVFHVEDAAEQLIAAADFAEIAAPRLNVAAVQLCGNQTVNLALVDPVVSAGSLRGFELATINPLLQGRIADAQDIGRFPRGKELLQGAPSSSQSSADRTDSSIRFYTLYDVREQRLVSEGFACLQRMRDAFLRFLFATERHEGFALQIQQVLLTDRLWCGQGTASQDIGQLARHVRVVFRCVPSAHQQMNAHFRGCKE